MHPRVSRRTLALFIICLCLCMSGLTSSVAANTITHPPTDLNGNSNQPYAFPTDQDTIPSEIYDGDSAHTSLNSPSEGSIQRYSSSNIVFQSGTQTANVSNENSSSEPHIVVSSIHANRTSAPVGAPIKITVNVKNTGDVAGAQTINITSLGDSVERGVSLDAGETTSISRVAHYPTGGNYQISAGNKQTQLTIGNPNRNSQANTPSSGTTNGTIASSTGNQTAQFEIVDFETTNTTIEIGERVQIKAIIENTGDEKGSHVVELKENGKTTDQKQVSLNPAASSTVEFSVSYGSPGTYEVSVGKQDILVEVKRGLNRDRGIGVGNNSNITAVENATSPQATDDGENSSESNAKVQSNTKSSGGDLSYFFIGIGIVLLLIFFLAFAEVIARWIQK